MFEDEPASPESNLIHRVTQLGDRNALEELLRLHHGGLIEKVRRMLARRGLPLVAADDFAQETMISVFRKVHEFKPETSKSFMHWMVRIAKNKIIDAKRMLDSLKHGGGWRQVGAAQGSWVGLLDQLSSGGGTPSRDFAMNEALDILALAVTRLKKNHRRVIKLRYIDGLSLAETAAVMETSEKSVERLCSRAKMKLRESMGSASQYPH